MLTLLAFLALSGSQSSTVDFTCRAKPLSQLLIDLSKVTGLNLKVSAECANDVLVVAVKDVSPTRLLAEIAKIDAGQWQTKGDDLLFVSDAKARHAEARAEMAKNIQIIRAEIAAQKLDAAKKIDWESNPDQGPVDPILKGLSAADLGKIRSVIGGAAIEDATMSLLAQQNLEPVASLQDQRVVFSTKPNRMQAPFASGADEAIASFIATHNSVVKLLTAAIEANTPKSATGDATHPPFYTSPVRPNQPFLLTPIPEVAKADLAIEGANSAGTLDARLVLYTSQGEVAFESDMYVMHTVQPDAEIPANPAIIKPSDAALGFRNLFAHQMDGKTDIVEVPPALVPFLMDPEHNDPLSLTPSDEILTFAKSQSQPLIALVPDSAFIDTLPEGMRLTLEQFTHWLALGDPMTMTKSGGWVEISPANPASERQFRCDRAVLGQFLRSCIKESIPTLSEFAEFAKKAEYANNPLVQAYVSAAVAGFGNGGLGTDNNWDLYRIFAELTDDQRAALVAGGKLPLTSFTPGQTSGFLQLAYAESDRLLYGVGPRPLSKPFPSARPIGNSPQQPMPPSDLAPRVGYEDEPTELLPDGAEKDAFLEFQVVPETFVSPVVPTGVSLTIPRVIGVAQVANRLARSGTSPSALGNAFGGQKFKLGTREVYQVVVHGSRKAFVTGRLYDFHLARDSADLAISDLPPDWQSELTRRMAALQQSQGPKRKRTPPP